MYRLEELSFMFEGKEVQNKVQSNINKQLELEPVPVAAAAEHRSDVDAAAPGTKV